MKKKIIAISMFILLFLTVISPIQSNAEKMPSEAGITFVEGTPPSTSTEPSTEPTTVPTTTDSRRRSETIWGETRSSGTGYYTEKPQGRFPSTGEIAKTSLSVLGIVLALMVIIVWMYRRKKVEKK